MQNFTQSHSIFSHSFAVDCLRNKTFTFILLLLLILQLEKRHSLILSEYNPAIPSHIFPLRAIHSNNLTSYVTVHMYQEIISLQPSIRLPLALLQHVTP